jgi:hypothetical protein
VVAFSAGELLEVGDGFELVDRLVADEIEAALVVADGKVVADGTVVAVLARAVPVTPIIVWALPLSSEKVPLPVLQSHLAFTTSIAQHH